MKKLLLIYFMIFTISLFAVVEETASFEGFMYGNAPECAYDNWESHVTEKVASPGYNKYAEYDRQLTGFGTYVAADTDQLLVWQTIVDEMVSGNLETAQEMIDENEIPYDVVIFHDTDSDRTFHLLRERLNLEFTDDNNTPLYGADDEIGGFDYSWGLYVFSPDAALPVIITTPHPTDDYTTTAISTKAFIAFDAMGWVISGAGREVLWNTTAIPNVGVYSNGKSISDPSRNLNHPFNKGYRKFCDKIRDTFDQRELSVQIHGYDWGNSHSGYANTQISAGYFNENPGLPIRDLSNSLTDIIQNSDAVVHPANSIGIHPEVGLNDYYSVVYREYGFVYDDGGDGIVVNNHYDLSGYSQNRQMQYSKTGWNNYDVFEPFFHIEMDELPNCYPQREENYQWFYGWDVVNQVWDYEHRYDHTFEFYNYWIEKLAEVLPEVLELNDGINPPTPENFQVITQANDFIKLQWDRIDCFDFDTVEILYSEEPIANGGYTTLSRNTDLILANMANETFEVDGLDPNITYYFQVRSKDKSGTYSDLSAELTGYSTPNIVDDFKAVGRENSVILSWNAEMQTELQGFIVYRSEGGEMAAISDLLPSFNADDQFYMYLDETAENDVEYQYQIEMITNSGETYFYGEIVDAKPSKIYQISFFIDAEHNDMIEFGQNKYASNGYDQDYDLDIDPEFDEDYLFAYLSEPTWDDYNPVEPISFSRDIYGEFDQTTETRKWDVKFKTDQIDTPITVNINNFDRDAERMYLKYNGQYIDLTQDELVFEASGDFYINFELYWGNLAPGVTIANIPREVIYPNTDIIFNWSFAHPGIVNNYDLILTDGENELQIASNLETNVASYDWEIPEVSLEGLHLMLRMNMNEGDIVETVSDDVFAIHPLDNYIDTYAGWQMMANPYLGFGGDPATYYGASMFYTLQGEDFIESDEVDYGTAYWQYSEEDFQATFNGTYESNDYSIDLNQGWNMIPNPFIVDFDINDAKFYYNGIQYEYNEAIQYDLIQPNFYAYEDGHFVVAEKMMPQKSYYLYSYQAEIEAQFTLYYANDIETNLISDWSMNLIADSGNDKSAVQVGMSISADSGYDKYYDLKKPNLKPMSDQIELSILEESTEFDLHKAIEPLSETEPIYNWVAKLITPNLEAVSFSSEWINIPENYNAYIIWEGENYRLTANNTVELTPTATETEFGILISDADADSQEDIILPEIALGNYPNPFNPTTTLAFSLVEDMQDVQLQIYNVKGQKVATLVNEDMSAGKHQVVWSGKDSFGKQVASGVYFAKLAAENETLKIHKLMLLK